MTPDIPQPPMAPQTTNAQNDPGQGLAIAGLILAFFFPLVGLILSIIAKKKSAAVGIKNTLAKVGVILNAVFLALGLLFTIGMIALIALTASSNIQEKAQQMQQQSEQQIQDDERAMQALCEDDPTYIGCAGVESQSSN